MSAADELRAIVGDDHVLTDRDVVAGYEVDWTGRFAGSTPAVVRPGSVAELAGVVRWARSERVALVTQGGNTGLVGGGVPLGGEIVVSTARFDHVAVDAVAGQATAGAGVTLGALQRAASVAGWRYGVDLAARDSATVGGSIATNAGGTHVIAHGMTRRQLVGIEAVLGTGEVVEHLSGLEKDNTGYDLAGLLCGSEGTLGIVTRARLRLVPAVAHRVTALVGLDDLDTAADVTRDLRRSVPGVEAIEFVLAAGVDLVAEHLGTRPPFVAPVSVLVEAAGSRDPTEPLAAAIGALGLDRVAVATDDTRRTELWRWREAHTEAINAVGPPLKLDVTVPLARLADFCTEMRDLDGDVWLFGHLGDGNVHVNVTGVDDEAAPERITDRVVDAVVGRGGSISAEHGIGTAKKAWLARQRSPAELGAMRAIKAALDPDRVLNPQVLFA